MVSRRTFRLVLTISFVLAEKKEFGGSSEYPEASFLAFIVEWADEHGYMPSFVFQLYLDNPKDFQLLASYRKHKAQKEKEEIEKAKNK